MTIVISTFLAAGVVVTSPRAVSQEPPSHRLDRIGIELPTPAWCGDCLRLGVSAAIAGDLAVLGDDGRRDGPPKAGVLVIYRLVQGRWQPFEGIQAPIPGVGDAFGASIALDGDRMLVGSPGDPLGGPPGGRAWIYRLKDGRWQPETLLAPAAPHPGLGYGSSVAIRGDVAAIGSPSWDHDGNWDLGRVEIFRRSQQGWHREAILDAPMQATSTRFGWSIAFTSDGQQLLIGAPGYDLPVDRTGAVFAARDVGAGCWAMSGLLQRTDPHPLDRFGGAIGCTSSHAVVGIEGSDLGQRNSGAIAVAETSPNFRLKSEHVEPAEAGGRLGARIAARNGMAVVWAGGVQPPGGGRGRVRILRYSKGDFHPVLDVHGHADLPPIGAALAVDGQQVLITAVVDEDGMPEPGRAWILKPAATPNALSGRQPYPAPNRSPSTAIQSR